MPSERFYFEKVDFKIKTEDDKKNKTCKIIQ